MIDFWKVGIWFIAMIFAVIVIVTTVSHLGHVSDYVKHLSTMH